MLSHLANMCPSSLVNITMMASNQTTAVIPNSNFTSFTTSSSVLSGAPATKIDWINLTTPSSNQILVGFLANITIGFINMNITFPVELRCPNATYVWNGTNATYPVPSLTLTNTALNTSTLYYWNNVPAASNVTSPVVFSTTCSSTESLKPQF